MSSSTGSARTHLDDSGRPRMIDISSKRETKRSATAQGRLLLPENAFQILITSDITAEDPSAGELKAHSKGNALVVAQLAGIMAAKRTADLIPLCHPSLGLTNIDVQFSLDDTSNAVTCEATVGCVARTGVEMEALSAVTVGLLTVWDMVKAVAGQEMVITDIKVVRKSGGKSGDWERPRP